MNKYYEHRMRYSEAIKNARLNGPLSFQKWFNKAESLNESFVRGFWDFSFHILTPNVQKLITKPENKIALEIGYGGGRLINAACNFFHQVIGIDIHNEIDTVNDFLKSQGKHNFQLMKTEGQSIDLPSESMDFVYSFIVLQHLPSFDIFVNYCREVYRCLKPMGVAQLYFGKFTKMKPMDQLIFFIQGYKEISNAPVNHTSLRIRINKVKKICKKIGFNIIKTGSSFKNVPDGYPRTKGGQNYITLQKYR